MVIVLIVMSLTALMAPSAIRAFAGFRAQSASLEVLRMARIARREAMEGGRAIAIITVGGRVEIHRGTTNLCRTSNWIAEFGDACATAADLSVIGTSCVGYVDPTMFDTGFHSVRITPVDGQNICYQPNGEGFLAPAGSSVFTRPPAGGLTAIRFQIDRLEGGTAVDPVRTVIFPVDSSPRSVR